MAAIKEFLRQRQEKGLLRVLKPVSCRHEGRLYIGKEQFIDFSSNDYLGLSEHPKLKEEAKKAIDKFGTASSASRLMSGYYDLHHQLEKAVADFKNKESALVFNSGYQANIGIISALYAKDDCIFSDRLNHASIVDGALLSGSRIYRFQHNDMPHLELLLQKERSKFKKALIITETVFSMDGDISPLKELVCLKKKYNCEIFVDEAHATGIFGRKGSGMVELEGLQEEIDFIMGTFGKALAGFGAYLAASKEIVEYLINACRSFIYSTALPPAVIACNLKSIELIKEEPRRREELLMLASYFRNTLKERGIDIRGLSQIVPVITKDNDKTRQFANLLQEKGYWVLPIRPPTVPTGLSRLRFSLTLHHNKEILEKLIDDICSLGI